MREATLCYPVDGDRVLLIEKRRGVGDGLVNGPGGKLEPGETPRECVVREVDEEVGVAVDPWKVGELDFTFGVHESVALVGSSEQRSDGDELLEWNLETSVEFEASYAPSQESSRTS